MAMGMGHWFKQRCLLTGPGQWHGVPWDLSAMVGAGQGHSWGCQGSVTSGPDILLACLPGWRHLPTCFWQ